jgi:DNA-binding FrmR family transcriptional regulator
VKLLEDHVRHCVADALAAGDAEVAEKKSEDLLAAVQRFSRTR